MKKIIFSIFIAASLLLQAQEKSDTLQVILNPSQVLITTTPTTTNIVVNGKKNDKGFKYIYSSQLSKEKATEAEIEEDDGIPEGEDEFGIDITQPIPRETWKMIYGKFLYVGWIHPVDCPKWVQGSFEIGLSQIAGVQYKPWRKGPVVNLGVGLGYKQFLAKNDMHYSKQGEALTGEKITPGLEVDKSKIKCFSIQVPVMITQRLYKEFSLSLGGIVNFNTYTTAFTQTKHESETVKTIYKGLHQRFFSCDVMAVLGWPKDIGVYFKYSPMAVFEKNMGPEINSISVGAMFNF